MVVFLIQVFVVIGICFNQTPAPFDVGVHFLE